jgi:hypothetical protein
MEAMSLLVIVVFIDDYNPSFCFSQIYYFTCNWRHSNLMKGIPATFKEQFLVREGRCQNVANQEKPVHGPIWFVFLCVDTIMTIQMKTKTSDP